MIPVGVLSSFKELRPLEGLVYEWSYTSAPSRVQSLAITYSIVAVYKLPFAQTFWAYMFDSDGVRSYLARSTTLQQSGFSNTNISSVGNYGAFYGERLGGPFFYYGQRQSSNEYWPNNEKAGWALYNRTLSIAERNQENERLITKLGA